MAPDPGEADSRSLPLYSVCCPRPSLLAFPPSPFPKNFPGRTRVLDTFKVCFARTPAPNALYNPRATQNFFLRCHQIFFQSAVTNVTSGEDASQQVPFKKNRMSPLAPLENGAEIEELLKFHCQLFAKVSGIFLRSCFAWSES